ncbi:MAG: phosphohydrolase [Candidatus Thorarchaeota archaeon]|nr:MAG: phosphohydrolase [Candidatus Thorarchaeota archaeon]
MGDAVMARSTPFDREKVSVRKTLGSGTKSLEMYQYLSRSPKVQSYLRSANRMAVSRLGYTDHGPVHAEVATWNALTAFDILDQTFRPNVVAEGIGDTDDARMVVLASTYLHDIGMVVHRNEHPQAAVPLASAILEEKLAELYEDPGKATDILSFMLHGIYAHDDDTQCLTFEAGVTKLGDGCDMTKGRTTIPFQKGKVDIHSLSAMAINDVILERGTEKPLQITVDMDNPAGVFQVQAVLEKKISTSGLSDYVSIEALVNGDRLILSQVKRLFRVEMADSPPSISVKEK